MKQVVATTAVQEPPPHSAYDYLTAMAGLSLPITALFGLIALILVSCRLVSLDAEIGKLKFKLHRPVKNTDAVTEQNQTTNKTISATDARQIDYTSGATTSSEEEDEPLSEVIKSSNEAYEYIRQDDIYGLMRTWPPFRSTLDATEVEFWETRHFKLLADHGADHGRDALKALTTQNPNWAAPFGVLIDWSISDGDICAAQDYLKEGLTRRQSSQFGDVLDAGVRLHFEIGGFKSAEAFCAEWAKSNVTQSEKSRLFSSYAAILKDKGNTEGYRIASEWAIISNPSMKKNSFNLAFNYADENSHWIRAAELYFSCMSNDFDGKMSMNNMAVILGDLDKAVQIEYYEKSALRGEDFATVNLANLLISDGYVLAAERLLKTVKQEGNIAELHASTAAKAFAARRNMEEKQKDLHSLISEQNRKILDIIKLSYRRIMEGGKSCAGWYVSEDAFFRCYVSPAEAKCLHRRGNSDFEGSLQNEGSCYSGSLKQVNGGLLSFRYAFTLIDVGQDKIVLIEWPSAVGADRLPVFHTLHYRDTEPGPLPALLPPPPPQAINALLSSRPSPKP